MFKRLLQLPLDGDSSIFLFGPRGTGKTSWLKEHLPNELYIDLLDFQIYSELVGKPHHLAEKIAPDYKGWVIIDEVQKIPEILNEVHRLIENKKIKFILTGSSARKLRKKGVNLLAGRALTYYMHPLVIQEMGELFHLTHALKFGLLPAAVTHKDPTSYLESYVETYIREEVLQEGLTRNIGVFTQFLRTASFSQGQVLNTSNIARELQISRTTVDQYFDILDDLLMGIRIAPFTQRAQRNIVRHSKFFFFDTGVYKILRPQGPRDASSELDGAGLETLFLQSLRAINDYYRLRYDIYFWRTENKQEVDFVLYGPRGFHAFEIKHSESLHNQDFKGLRLFEKDYPEAKLHFIYRGHLKSYHTSITAYPFVEALKELPNILQ